MIALLGFALLLLVASPARADFRAVASGLVGWQWTTAPGPIYNNGDTTNEVSALAVRPDGWLIVAAEHSLHLIPPWGADISGSNRFGPAGFDPYDMVIRERALYATVQTDIPQDPCHLYKIDAYSGRLLTTYSDSWMQCYIPHITLDPSTNHLVLQALDSPPCPLPSSTTNSTLPLVPDHSRPGCEKGGIYVGTGPTCGSCYAEVSEPFNTPIVEWDPDTGARTTLVSNPRTPYSDLGFAADGSEVYVGEIVQVPQSAPLYIDAYPRRNGVLPNSPAYRIPLPNDTGVGGITAGNGSHCFGNSLIYTDSWSDVYVVPRPGPTSTTSIEVATTPYPPGSVRYADAAGNVNRDLSGNAVVGEYDSVMVLACPGFRPPAPPRLSVLPLAPVISHLAGPVRPGTPASGLTAPGTPPAAPAGPAPAPSLSASSQASTQAAAAPNAAGVGDVVEDQPAFHLTATGRPPGPLAWGDLALGAGVVSGLAACAWAVLETTDRREIAAAGRERFETGDNR